MMLAICLLGLVACPRAQRWPMVLSGLLVMPFSLYSLPIEPEYWHPTRVAVLFIGPEDILIAFGSGGTVWLLSTWLVRDRLTVNLNPSRMARRYLLGTLGGLIIGAICRLAGAGPITAMVISFFLFALCVFWLGGKLWPLAVAGLSGFTVVYFAVTKLVFTLNPGFLNQWNTAALWGPRVLGIPLDEIAAAAGFGLAWPLFAAYFFDTRLEALEIEEMQIIGGSVECGK
jgi:hypothetical protein